MNPHRLYSNPSSLKSKFTKGFLRSLTKIKRERSSSCSPREIFRRYWRVKAAADKSLACAVGYRRAWSRAMLYKIQNQAKRRHTLVRRIKKRDRKRTAPKEEEKRGGEDVGFGRATDLRELVPGGQAMDLCRLLEEAADYIKSLNTQVQVMRCIADLYTA